MKYFRHFHHKYKEKVQFWGFQNLKCPYLRQSECSNPDVYSTDTPHIGLHYITAGTWFRSRYPAKRGQDVEISISVLK